LRDKAKWKRLHEFICRFASPGANIITYLLKGDELPTAPIVCMKKNEHSLFQLPECTVQPTLGVSVYSKIAVPIAKWDIKDDWVDGWTDLQNALRG
jgi:hypothetical protein